MENELSTLIKQPSNDKNKSKKTWKYIILGTIILALLGLATWMILKTNSQFGSSLFLTEAETETAQTTETTQSPNIIFIVIDDIGWGDISLHGAEYDTPVLDQFISTESIFFDSHYGLLCTPSRTQFLSGRYAFNLGVANLEPFEYKTISVVPHQIPFISDILKKYTDYQTYLIGKWHLGYVTEDSLPNKRGFDYFYGFHGAELDYYTKTAGGGYYDWFENSEVDETGTDGFSTIQLSDKLTEKLEEIDVSGNKEPFFMYVGVQSPHVPLTSSPDPETQKKCQHVGGIDAQTRNYFCQNVIEIDNLMSNLVNDLKNSQSNLWDNTILIFTSDNGGDFPNGGCNYPYRGDKGQYFEGGIRTLTFISGGYDAIQSQFGQTRESIFHGVDWTPTLLSFAMNNDKYLESLNDIQKNYEFDGIDQTKFILFGDKYNIRDDAPIIVRSDTNDDNAIVFTYNDIRYKYIIVSDSRRATNAWCYFDESTNTRETTPNQYDGNEVLFNLDEDPYEHVNLLNDNIDAATQEVYEFVLKKLETYRGHKYFNDYLSCFLDQTHPIAEPGETDGAFRPFLSNEQFNTFFDDYCASEVNDELRQLFYATVETE